MKKQAENSRKRLLSAYFTYTLLKKVIHPELRVKFRYTRNAKGIAMNAPSTVDKMYEDFEKISISELEESLAATESREEKLFCRALINLKLQLAQEKIIGETLL